MIWIPIGITALGMWTISFAVGVLPMLIFVHGYWSFLFIILFCFAVGLVLNWRLPKSSRPLARLWPLMCFMMGMAYKDFLYVNIENTSYIWWGCYLADAFVICLFPALLGLLAGKILKW
jgi:hypothetical protein